MPELSQAAKELVQNEIKAILVEDPDATAAGMLNKLKVKGICSEVSKAQVKNLAKKIRQELGQGPACEEIGFASLVLPFTVCEAECGKGLGCFATRDIKKHELILKERPMLLASKEAQFKYVTPIEVLFSRLTSDAQTKVMELHDAWAEAGKGKSVIGVMRTNAMEVGGCNEAPPASALFLIASRLNHSCVPNVARGWHALGSDSDGEVNLYAMRDVKQGDELCMSYLNIAHGQSRTARQAELRDKYHFVCSCGACMASPDEVAKSDANRRTIGEIEAKIKDYDTPSHPQELMDRIERLMHLYIIEKLDSPQTMGRLADDATETCPFLQKPRLTTLRFAKMCYDNYLLAYGEGHEQTRKAKDWVRCSSRDTYYRQWVQQIKREQSVVR